MTLESNFLKLSFHVLSTYHEHQKETGQMEGKRGEKIFKLIKKNESRIHFCIIHDR